MTIWSMHGIGELTPLSSWTHPDSPKCLNSPNPLFLQLGGGAFEGVGSLWRLFHAHSLTFEAWLELGSGVAVILEGSYAAPPCFAG